MFVSETYSIRDVKIYYPNENAIKSDTTARTDVGGRVIYKKALPFGAGDSFTLEFKFASWGYPTSYNELSSVIGIDLLSMSDYTIRCALLAFKDRIASYYSSKYAVFQICITMIV